MVSFANVKKLGDEWLGTLIVWVKWSKEPKLKLKTSSTVPSRRGVVSGVQEGRGPTVIHTTVAATQINTENNSF
jgi:hypothetical protein